jgi:hypothetical protein
VGHRKARQLLTTVNSGLPCVRKRTRAGKGNWSLSMAPAERPHKWHLRSAAIFTRERGTADVEEASLDTARTLLDAPSGGLRAD